MQGVRLHDASTLAYLDTITAETGRGGIDVILSLAPQGEAPEAASLLSDFGRYVQIQTNEERAPSWATRLRVDQIFIAINPGRVRGKRRKLMEQSVADLLDRLGGIPLPPCTIRDTAVVDTTFGSEVFRADGTYLVTGGFGGFGLKIAHFLGDRGAGHIVLIGRRSSYSPEIEAEVLALADTGTQVHRFSLDIGLENEIRAMLSKLALEAPPVRGVFHCAAVLAGGLINTMTGDQMRVAMKAKALGAWHLHKLTQDLPISHFVLLSSIASLIGSPGDGSYLAGNTSLDMLAQYRRQLNLPANTINWGALAGGGMAVSSEIIESNLSHSGFGFFTANQAMDTLDHVLAMNQPCLGAAMMDWAPLCSLYPHWAASPRNSVIAAESATKKAGGNGDFRHQLLALDDETRVTRLTSIFLRVVADVLGLAENKVEPHHSLLGMGIDSLMAIDLQIEIEMAVGLKLPALELIRCDSVAALVPLALVVLSLQRALSKPTTIFLRLSLSKTRSITPGDEA
jgi:NAD(P)-dependent dehydrogenase (short-subunit alcohol dehydrogenase family)/acyl carrier protein